ncbi:hypothetical protein [Sandaracinus amylolyticus]|uniref:Uncharacterized protein n=1 Tax=Sandaracinus amylolyticus TaxID=927083 RepID=A0A0F6W655_9BACT|nr:hypothetical protein [Sandaracinus amylolyticus]AKF08481.1 hypothetical protein DB32_005630 [Sandaracinus amylolyticus]
MDGQALFDKVVAASGVSAVLAPGLVKRALLDGKVQIEAATAADYRAALPRILARMRAYMPEEEAQRRARRIGAMLAQVESGRTLVEGEDETDWSLVGRVNDALRAGPPAEGVRRSSTQSGERSLDELDDDITVLGRRYTAHERELLRKAGAPVKDPTQPFTIPPRTGSGDDER